jgi:hypothetical protein
MTNIPHPGIPKTPTEMVKEFQDAFQMEPDLNLWLRLMEEEAKEVREAFLHLAKELADYTYVVTGAGLLATATTAIHPTQNDRLAKALLKQVKEFMGPEFLKDVFERVHASNMSKLGEDGKPIKREDGKIQKGPNYKEPDLEDLI